MTPGCSPGSTTLPERRFESNGYALSAYQMTLKNGDRVTP